MTVVLDFEARKDYKKSQDKECCRQDFDYIRHASSSDESVISVNPGFSDGGLLSSFS